MNDHSLNNSSTIQNPESSSSLSLFQQPIVYPQSNSPSRGEPSSQTTSKRRKTSDSGQKKPAGVDINYTYTLMNKGSLRQELRTLLLDQFSLPALESIPPHITLSSGSSSHLPAGAQNLFRCLYTVFRISAKYVQIAGTTFDHFPLTAERINHYWEGMSSNSKNLFSSYCNDMFFRRDSADAYMGIRNKGPSFLCFKHLVDRYELSPLTALREKHHVKLEQFIRFHLLSRLSWGIPLIMEQYPECDSPESLNHSDTTWEIEIQAFIKTHYPTRECLRLGAKRTVPYFDLKSPKTYGNLRYSEDNRATTTSDILSKSSILAQYISQNWSRNQSPLPFADFIKKLDNLQINYFKDGHLLNWLTASDLVEFGILAPPISLDLARYLLVAKAAGATGGVSTALGLHNLIISDLDFQPFTTKSRATDLFRSKLQLWSSFLNYTSRGLEHLIGPEWESLSGRPLTISDLEHLLCKVTRLRRKN